MENQTLNERREDSELLVGAERVRSFYDEFSASRMQRYLYEKNDRIEKAIARILPLVATDTAVLEIGCGIGLVVERIAGTARNGSIWACDISERCIQHARERVKASYVHFRSVDVLRSFDELRTWISKSIQLVIMVDVIEHFPLEVHSSFLRNLRGIMAKDATLILTYPSPQYQLYLREKEPDELQIIDEVVELSHIQKIASENGFELKHYSLEDVWLKNQYVHCVLSTSTALRAIDDLDGLKSAMREVGTLIPSGQTFILVDVAHWRTEEIDGRLAIPFLERDGTYWGPPPDDETAIRELERLRQSGANFIVFAWPAFWWLDYYSGFHRYLRSRFPCILENDRLVVFALRP